MPRALFSLLFLLLVSSAYSQRGDFVEFRGVWVATVKNIDWPASGQLEVQEQKDAYIKILDFYEELNFNAVIVQVRCAGDALYPSDIVPWSRFLTGIEGKSGAWQEDPLTFLIAEAHKRGMEFHAWMNPYRATLDEDTSALSQDHITKLHPEWIVKYGSKSYLNPGEPTVRHYLTSLIEEVVRKYDIDAIHFDDYFYPYKIEGLEFDDREAFMKHGLAYFQEREDWRRANVDSLVKDVAFTIRKVKPWVQFGISPFGVWRNESQDPKGSKTFANQTTYDDLYADPLNWMKNDWIDYLVPQQYWSMDYGPASYRELTGWWNRQSADHATYIGIGAYKVKNNHDKAWNDLKEIPRQLYLARSTNNIKGTVFFSARSLMKQRQLTQDLKRNFYQHPALPMEVRATDKDLSGPDIERATVDNRGKLIIQLDKKPLVDQLVVRHYSSTGILNYMKKAWVYDNTVSLDLGMDSAGITLSWLNRDNEMSVESKKINTEFKKGKWKTTWP